ncbi:hypothetical protein F2Q69_00003819 [Brassica cretica]|uniref:F-box associated beta-propeller type 1 domain-containing protein n=1 Tax=Brassica cretica TaxID=69181 RepID=A0A8S9P1G9_BRACR|nr:hypothetical protein F2Q69_00003819 [Brassica cretica]
MRSQFRLWLMSVDFHGSLNHKDDLDVAPYVKEGKLTSLNNSDPEISKVFHCNGLLLCSTKDNRRLVVWNPYLGQTRRIKPRIAFHKRDLYALGYDVNKNQKILRFLDDNTTFRNPYFIYEIYDLKSSSWRVLDVNADWEIDYYHRGLSLKGTEETVALSSVREEQLAVLYQGDSSCLVEIWVTNRIEPNAVSWSKLFLSVDIETLFGPHLFHFAGGSFIIDEEQKLAVIFDKDEEEMYNKAYLIGENGCYKTLDLQEDTYHRAETGEFTSMPLVCSYFPTSVKIQQRARRGKRKERDY